MAVIMFCIIVSSLAMSCGFTAGASSVCGAVVFGFSCGPSAVSTALRLGADLGTSICSVSAAALTCAGFGDANG